MRNHFTLEHYEQNTWQKKNNNMWGIHMKSTEWVWVTKHLDHVRESLLYPHFDVAFVRFFSPPRPFLPAHFACDRLLAVSIKAAQHDNVPCVLWDAESLIAYVNCTNRVGSTSERLFEMYVGASFTSQEVKHLWQWTEHALKHFLHIHLINSVSAKDIQGVYLVLVVTFTEKTLSG